MDVLVIFGLILSSLVLIVVSSYLIYDAGRREEREYRKWLDDRLSK